MLVLLGLVGTAAAVVAAIAIILYLPSDSTSPAVPQAQPPPAPVPTVSGIGRIATPTAPGFPAPLRGAVVYAREDGSDALALSIVPRTSLVLRASVVGPEGTGVKGLDVRFRVGTTRAAARPCGAGCYSATLTPRGRPRQVEVVVTRRAGTTRWNVVLPAAWPPRPAATLVQHAANAFARLRGVTFEERLASDQKHAVNTRWRLEAPDRLAYQVHGGSAAIQIGARRWDRAAGGDWEPSEATRLPQPSPQWEAVTDARILGRTTFRGRPVVEVSFFDPRTPAWFHGLIDPRTDRMLDLQMVATAHFMHEVYGPFNGPAQIAPPS